MAVAGRRSRACFEALRIGTLSLAVGLPLGASIAACGGGDPASSGGSGAPAALAGGSGALGMGGTAASAGALSGAGGTSGSAENAGLGAAAGAAGAGSSGGASAGGNGGSGGAISAMWTTNAGKYVLTLGSTYLEIDPANGARLTALRVGGSAGPNLLADSTVTGQADNWGSTFWPSPQTWVWPPTAANSINAINTLPYTAVLEGSALSLTSSVNSTAPKLSVIKKFSPDLAKEAIVIDYTMTNGGAEPVTTAPWEITRVAPGGITFYPAATPPYTQATPLLATSDLAGATWYRHDPTDMTLYKLFGDGKDGWLAHADGDLLLIKSFADLPAGAAAKNEAEIEIYAAPKYVEMEHQGAVQTLAAGQALHWTVRWYARKLSAPAAVGSAELVDYVQNQIK